MSFFRTLALALYRAWWQVKIRRDAPRARRDLLLAALRGLGYCEHDQQELLKKMENEPARPAKPKAHS